MYTFEESTFINCPQQEVWDFISNPANLTQWSSSNEFAEWTSAGPPGVGSTQREVGKIFGRNIEVTSEITVWDPPNEYGRKSVDGPLPFETTMKLEPKENGTQFTVIGQGEFRGFLKIAEGLVVKLAEKQTDAQFEALKRLLEAGQA